MEAHHSFEPDCATCETFSGIYLLTRISQEVPWEGQHHGLYGCICTDAYTVWMDM